MDSGKVNIIFSLLILSDSLTSPSLLRFSFTVSGRAPSCAAHPSAVMLLLNVAVVISKIFLAENIFGNVPHLCHLPHLCLCLPRMLIDICK